MSVPNMPDEEEPRSLKKEMRAILATYIFAALLPLLAGFQCSGEREKEQRARGRVTSQVQGEGTESIPHAD